MKDEASNELDFTDPGVDWHRGAAPAASRRPDAATASATPSSATRNPSETTIFQAGELSGLLGRGESAPVRGIAKTAATGALPQSGPAGPATANVVAVIEWPSGATTQFSARLNIGRDWSFCPFAAELASDTHISRQHAVLEACAGGIRVRDLASRNGTFVDGEKIPSGQAVLVDRDAQIWFGSCSVVRLTLKR